MRQRKQILLPVAVGWQWESTGLALLFGKGRTRDSDEKIIIDDYKIALYNMKLLSKKCIPEFLRKGKGKLEGSLRQFRPHSLRL
jgi:hypothetical protein